jgi:hypothetical protein
MPASACLPPEHGLAPLLRGPLWPARPAGANPPSGTRHCSKCEDLAIVWLHLYGDRVTEARALRGMPAARACHRRQLLLLRQRPPDHRAATRTRRPARRASAGLDGLPRLATSPPTAMPRRSQIAASIKSRDAQDPAPILVTGRVLRDRCGASVDTDLNPPGWPSLLRRQRLLLCRLPAGRGIRQQCRTSGTAPARSLRCCGDGHHQPQRRSCLRQQPSGGSAVP